LADWQYAQGIIQVTLENWAILGQCSGREPCFVLALCLAIQVCESVQCRFSLQSQFTWVHGYRGATNYVNKSSVLDSLISASLI